ncbi:hypothetical protein M9H77_23088 [Catharanthus roseus]|uniref:Uncharacterized protein n=1 Tax=Catharanthus roseus TaxID=4058 RepID=A0ACC0ATU2_CATRO|nr:hypothetical protein M9H77_23088 [Catharanthus roseus]
MKGLPYVGTVGKFQYSVLGGLFSSKSSLKLSYFFSPIGSVSESSNDEAMWAQIGFHCNSFTSSSQAMSYVTNTLLEGLSTTDGDRRDDYEIVLLHQAREAKRPFQFLSNMLLMLNASSNRCKIPITQDASASAYQILSYFLLDETLAFRTNVIPSPKGEIEDIYILPYGVHAIP